jgi:hypothetical protein
VLSCAGSSRRSASIDSISALVRDAYVLAAGLAFAVGLASLRNVHHLDDCAGALVDGIKLSRSREVVGLANCAGDVGDSRVVADHEAKLLSIGQTCADMMHRHINN